MGIVSVVLASLVMGSAGGNGTKSPTQSLLPFYVCLSRDPKLLAAVAKSKTAAELDGVVASQNLYRSVTNDNRVVLLDQRLFRSANLPPIGDLTSRSSLDELTVLDCDALTAAQRQGINRLILSSTFAPHFAKELVVCRDLKIAIQPWVVATLQNGDQTIEVGMGLGQRPDTSRFVTKSLSDKVGLGFTRKAASKVSSVPAPEAIQAQFSPSVPREEQAKLMREASNELENRIKTDNLQIEDTLRSVIPAEATHWDPTMPTKISSLTPSFAANLEATFASTSLNYGFKNQEAARAWFRQSTIHHARVDVMVWVAMNRSTGPLMSGFLLGNCQN